MFRIMAKSSVMTLALVAGLQVGGCGSLIPLQPVAFNLGPGLGEFEVLANQPLTKSGAADFDAPVTLRRGTLTINPDVISLTPANNVEQKGRTTFQSTTTIEVTVWIAEPDQLETVFDDGVQYGPFTIVFDADFQPVSISPSTVMLEQSTIDLLNSGQFSIGLQVVSPVDGTIVIGSLTFNVGV